MADSYKIDSLDGEALRFLSVVCHRDQVSRNRAMTRIQESVQSWLDGYGSPPPPPMMKSGAGILIGMDRREFLQEILPGLLRLSLRCPFADVRDKCRELLTEIEERGGGLKIPRPRHGPSRFIAENEVVPIDTGDEETQMVFLASFLQNNRLEHIHQVMGYHPAYLEAFLKTQNYLIHQDGPLPFYLRHYIAIIAAARHQCLYLVRLHTQEFLLCGGDPEWLRGLNYVPRKVQELYEVNKIMAHRPWIMNKQHIESLARGNDPWSLSELTQALVILAHFHSLCCFAFGCGITMELDQGGCTLTHVTDDESDEYSSDSSYGEPNANVIEEGGLETLMLKMKQLSGVEEEETTEEELIKQFESVENQSAEISVPTLAETSAKEEIVRFIRESDFIYIDFARRPNKSMYPTFRIQDYSWEDHCFSLANRLYPDIGNLLDDKFSLMFNLTYCTMGKNKDVNTSAFRQTLWYYIHVLYGIYHDDFNYVKTNELLPRDLKTYIKTLACYPERITKKDYNSVMPALLHSEKVHLNLMVTEARMQAELLYALRAVNRYMT